MKNMTVLHNRTCGNQWCRGYDAPSIGIRDYQLRHFDIRRFVRNLWPKRS